MTSIIEFSSDISQQEEPSPLPVGNYPAEIVAAERLTSGMGNPYIALTFSISPNDYPADYVDGDPDGTRLIYRRLSLADKPQARYAIKRFCMSVGLKVPGTTLDLTDWLGTMASVTIAHRQFEDTMRAEITAVAGA